MSVNEYTEQTHVHTHTSAGLYESILDCLCRVMDIMYRSMPLNERFFDEYQSYSCFSKRSKDRTIYDTAPQFALNMLQLSLGFSDTLHTVTYYAHKDIEID